MLFPPFVPDSHSLLEHVEMLLICHKNTLFPYAHIFSIDINVRKDKSTIDQPVEKLLLGGNSERRCAGLHPMTFQLRVRCNSAYLERALVHVQMLHGNTF